jgi:hypothetical protein
MFVAQESHGRGYVHERLRLGRREAAAREIDPRARFGMGTGEHASQLGRQELGELGEAVDGQVIRVEKRAFAPR